MKISDQLHAFIWSDYRANSANPYLILGKIKILIDPGHERLNDGPL